MLGEEPRRDPIAGLAEFVDTDHLDEPGLHQIVERVELLLGDFSHAVIVADAGHHSMNSRQTDDTDSMRQNMVELIYSARKRRWQRVDRSEIAINGLSRPAERVRGAKGTLR
jgi:hypothetical protein